MVDSDEIMHFIDDHNLFGKGIGYVDVHLLAAASLADNCSIWTRDKRLRLVADRLKVTTITDAGLLK